MYFIPLYITEKIKIIVVFLWIRDPDPVFSGSGFAVLVFTPSLNPFDPKCLRTDQVENMVLKNDLSDLKD